MTPQQTHFLPFLVIQKLCKLHLVSQITNIIALKPFVRLASLLDLHDNHLLDICEVIDDKPSRTTRSLTWHLCNTFSGNGQTFHISISNQEFGDLYIHVSTQENGINLLKGDSFLSKFISFWHTLKPKPKTQSNQDLQTWNWILGEGDYWQPRGR